MKILYLDTPINPPGGGQISLLSMAAEIAKENQVKIFLNEKSSFETLLRKSALAYEIVPLKNLYYAIKKECPGVVHCNSATTRYSFISALSCKCLGIPFLWHVRVIDSAGWKDDVIAMLSSKIIVISEAVKKKFKPLWYSKIVKISNAVAPVFPDPDVIERLRKELDIDTETKVIGVFSRLVKGKGHDIFLRAAASILSSGLSVTFLIVGDGEEMLTLKKLSEELRISDKVIFTGYVKSTVEYMSVCDIIVNPSSKPEGFGRVIIESMILDKPVISTNLGASSEIIDNGINGILCEPTPQGLYSAILELLTNPSLSFSISENAKKKVAEKFSLDLQIKKIKSIYSEFVKI